MSNVGYSTLTVIPSLRGFGPALSKGADTASRGAGQRSGRAFGATFTKTSAGPIRSVLGVVAGPLAAGFAAVASVRVFRGFISDARESIKIGKLTAQVIKTTGGAARITAKGVGRLATAISKKTGIDDEAIQSSENLLLTFKNVKNETGRGNKVFSRATELVQDMGVALGQDGKSGAIQLGKALNDPIKGITALSRVGVSFTAQQKAQIKTLVESGNTLKAQKIILKELGDEFGGAARAAATPTDRLRVTLGNLKETVGGALVPVLDAAAGGLLAFGDAFTSGKSKGDGFVGFMSDVGADVKKLTDKLGAIDWKKYGSRAISGIKAGLRGAGRLWGTLKPNLTVFGTALFTAAKVTAQELINGVKVGLDTGDWGPLGTAITAGLGRAATGAKGLTDALGKWIKSVDWFALGKTAVTAAVPFTIAFVNGLAGAFLTTAKEHPLDVLAFVATIIPVGRAAGILEKLLGKLPIVGPLLRALKTVGSAVEGPVMRFLVKPFGRAIGFIGRELLNGFRLVFPKAGAELAHQLSLFPLKVAAFGIRMVIQGARLVAKLVEGLRSGLQFVGAQIGLIVVRIFRPFAKAGSFLFNAGLEIVKGLVRGIGAGFHFVKDKLGDLTGKLPDWKGPASTDRKILYKSGQLVLQGFNRGLESEFRSTRAQLLGMTHQLAAAPFQVGGRPLTAPRVTAPAAASTPQYVDNSTVIVNHPLPARAEESTETAIRRKKHLANVPTT